MTIAAPGRQQWTTSGLSEATVARVAAAVHVAMVCFVLVAVVTRHVGEGLGLSGQVAVVAGLLGVAVLLAVWPRRGGRP
jgi:hypothetical protein